MKIPPEIAFRNVAATEALRSRLADEIDRLDAFDDQLIGCRVMVELPQHRHKTGDHYRVRIHMTLPGEDLVINRNPPEHEAAEKLTQAIGEAFDRARRVLDEARKRRQGQVKHHELPNVGRVLRLYPSEGYGFIQSTEGQEIYFHENAILDGDFADLDVGTEVRFAEEQGDEGLQASSVRTVRPPRSSDQGSDEPCQ